MKVPEVTVRTAKVKISNCILLSRNIGWAIRQNRINEKLAIPHKNTVNEENTFNNDEYVKNIRN